MKKKFMLAIVVTLMFTVVAFMTACGNPDQETVDAAVESLSMTASVSSTKLNLPSLSGDYEGVELTYSSSNKTVISDDGAVSCGNVNVKVTITATATLNGATATKDFEVTVNLAHQIEYGSDATHHWESCKRTGCGYNSTEKVAHTNTAISQPKGEWTDGLSGNICSVCGHSESTNDYVAGFVFADADALISQISRASELTLTTNPADASSMKLTMHLQAQKAAASERTATLTFIAKRTETYTKDLISTVKIKPGEKTFTFEAELSDFFVPLAQDAYNFRVAIDGAEAEVTKAATSTFTAITNKKNAAGYQYTLSDTLALSRDADVTVTPWSASNILLTEKGGKAIVTVSGTAYINGDEKDNTTLPRTFKIWFINEAAAGRNAETSTNISTSADTRDFKFEIDVTDLASNNDWYKFTIGVNEGNGEVVKTNTAGTPSGEISTNGTERNFSNGDTSATVQSITVGGKSFKVVSAWSQVHLRV